MLGILRWLVAASAALISLTACTGAARMVGASDGGADSPQDGPSAMDGPTLGSDARDPDPVFSADEWTALQALSPTRLPPPQPTPPIDSRTILRRRDWGSGSFSIRVFPDSS